MFKRSQKKPQGGKKKQHGENIKESHWLKSTPSFKKMLLGISRRTNLHF